MKRWSWEVCVVRVMRLWFWEDVGEVAVSCAWEDGEGLVAMNSRSWRG